MAVLFSMKRFLALFSSVLVILFSCEPASPNNDDPHFTSDAEELFFKNMRQSEYQQEENIAAGLSIFIHNEQKENDLLEIKLIHNWRKDQAFVLLEWYPQREKAELFVDGSKIIWTGQSMSNHHNVTNFLFDAHSKGLKIRMNDTSLILTDANITTIKDYKKLISKK